MRVDHGVADGLPHQLRTDAVANRTPVVHAADCRAFIITNHPGADHFGANARTISVPNSPTDDVPCLAGSVGFSYHLGALDFGADVASKLAADHLKPNVRPHQSPHHGESDHLANDSAVPARL